MKRIFVVNNQADLVLLKTILLSISASQEIDIEYFETDKLKFKEWEERVEYVILDKQANLRDIRRAAALMHNKRYPLLFLGQFRWLVVRSVFGTDVSSVSDLTKLPPQVIYKILVDGDKYGIFDCRLVVKVSDLNSFSAVAEDIVSSMPSIFTRCGRYCVMSDESPIPLSEPEFTALLCQAVKFVDGHGEETPPPARFVRAVQPHIINSSKELICFVRHPVFCTNSGKLLTGKQFHTSTGIYTAYTKPVNLKRLTHDEVKQEIQSIKNYLVDFPFQSDSDFAVWFSCLLSHFVCFNRPVCFPLTIIDANTAGAGKTLLTKLILLITAGKVSAPAPFSSKEEFRKLILSFILRCQETLWLDNVVGELGSPVLDAILTSPCWSDRVLGSSQIASADLRLIPIVTANNATISFDLVRRSLRCRLLVTEERPELRQDFTFPDILHIFEENRDKIIASILNIIYSFWHEQKEGVVSNPVALGSFEAWSRFVATLCVHYSIGNPIETQDALISDSDVSRSSLVTIVTMWNDLLGQAGSQRVTVGELDALLKINATNDAWLPFVSAWEELCGGFVSAKDIARILRRYREKVVSGKRIVKCEEFGRVYWAVEDCSVKF